MVSTRATGISTFTILLLPALFIGIIISTVISGIYAEGMNTTIKNYDAVVQIGVFIGLLINSFISLQVYWYFESKEVKKERKEKC